MHEEHERHVAVIIPNDTPAAALEATFLADLAVRPGQQGGPTQSWWEDRVRELEQRGFALVSFSVTMTDHELAIQHDIMVQHLAKVARR